MSELHGSEPGSPMLRRAPWLLYALVVVDRSPA